MCLFNCLMRLTDDLRGDTHLHCIPDHVVVCHQVAFIVPKEAAANAGDQAPGLPQAQRIRHSALVGDVDHTLAVAGVYLDGPLLMGQETPRRRRRRLCILLCQGLQQEQQERIIVTGPSLCTHQRLRQCVLCSMSTKCINLLHSS